jgi:hypothetical protein
MHSEKGEEKLHLFAWVKYKQTWNKLMLHAGHCQVKGQLGSSIRLVGSAVRVCALRGGHNLQAPPGAKRAACSSYQLGVAPAISLLDEHSSEVWRVEILNCLLKESIARTLQLQRSFRRVHDAWVAKVVMVGGPDPLICKKKPWRSGLGRWPNITAKNPQTLYCRWKW